MADTDTLTCDLLVIGELNMDLILNNLADFPELGKEKLADDFSLTMGSSSAIFAANCSRLGANVHFCGLVGDDDFGKQIRDQLLAFGVDIRHVSLSPTYKTGLTVILRHEDDRAMITYPGAMEQFSLDDINPNVFSSARHLHISSLFLQPGIKRDLFSIVENAKTQDMTISVDPQWDPKEKWDIDFEKLVANIDYFLPNEEEFLSITGTSSVQAGVEVLQPYLKNGAIIIKQGTRGATLVTANKTKQIPGYTNDNPVDTVGAGDSFDAGFIYRRLQKATLRDSIVFGNITGAVSTTEAGGTEAIQSLQQVKQIAKKNFSIDDITG